MTQLLAVRVSPAATSPKGEAKHASLINPCDRAQLPVAQRGVALVVALILLVIITLIGLAAVSGTIMQGKMAANQYDRQTAFQNAASALRIAQEQLATNPGSVTIINCYTSTCASNPLGLNPVSAASINPVAAGTSPGAYTAGVLATGQPQFVIQNVANQVPDPESDTGATQTAGCHQRNSGSNCLPSPATYYRITARSGDPAVIGERAVVTLQTVVKKSK